MNSHAFSERSRAEKLLAKHFQSEPFHNLRLFYRDNGASRFPGGTCSDKAMKFVEDAREIGLQAYIHSAFIDAQEKHRLVRLVLDGETFFADVGDGWPSLHLFPAGSAVNYRCFGIRFRSEIECGSMKIFCARRGHEKIQCTVALKPRPEAEILEQISRRFEPSMQYPFSNSVRFSCVVGDTFKFLRGDQLECYDERGIFVSSRVAQDRLQDTLSVEFGFHSLELVPR